MLKVVDKENGYAIMNGINKNSRIFVPNGIEGKIRGYHIIDAVTIGNAQTHKTFAMLEHDELGEDDCIVVRLPDNGKMFIMIREDHKEWEDTGSEVAYFINASRIEVKESYNGLDDLEDLGYELYDDKGNALSNVQFWTEEEINDR